MVNALIRIGNDTNKVLNIVKAQHGFKDKGDAVDFVVRRFIDIEGEPGLRPEFVEKIKRIEKQESIRVEDFAERYGLKDV